VLIFRILAAVCGTLYFIVLCATFELATSMTVASGTVTVLTVVLQGLIAVSVLLAIAEGLRLGIAIERNTRSRQLLENQTDRPSRK
jgi:ABC-type proline/glycine betaine transport system permease subunit